LQANKVEKHVLTSFSRLSLSRDMLVVFHWCCNSSKSWETTNG